MIKISKQNSFILLVGVIVVGVLIFIYFINNQEKNLPDQKNQSIEDNLDTNKINKILEKDSGSGVNDIEIIREKIIDNKWYIIEHKIKNSEIENALSIYLKSDDTLNLIIGPGTYIPSKQLIRSGIPFKVINDELVKKFTDGGVNE